ncbi:AAA family ATPase [Streptomyces sp. NPDC015139]|uniref:AAA family ATPase n=1 Tax=Streptomyces sp. NPDC015139 TaxID=3364942 RepID=UPI0036FA65B1
MSKQDACGDSPTGGLVLLGGPPGAGKSTVAEALAGTAGRPTVHMHTDTFFVWIRSGFVPPYLPEAESQNDVVQKVMLDAACAYADGGYDVVLDGILGPWMLDAFRARTDRRGLDLSYVVLRPSLEVTLSRATRREGRHLKEMEPITGLHKAFEGIGALERHVLDSTAQTVEQTTAELAAGLETGRFSVGSGAPSRRPTTR